MTKIDQRIQKTNQALLSAFREMAKSTSYQNITVKKLTEVAGINRKTFYLHYDSIDDFSNTVVDEIADKLLSLIVGQPLKDSLSKPGYIFDRVFDFFQQSREYYTFMMTSVDYSFLSRKVESKVAKGFAQAIYKQYGTSELDSYICASFFIRNTLMMFRLYSSNLVQLDRSEFRDRLVRLNTSGLSSFIDLNR